MARGAGTLVRMAMAGLLVLAALVLFAMPSTAQACDHHEPCAATVAPDADRAVAAISVLSADPADKDDCGQHDGKPSVCCVGSGCVMMHGGMAPAGLLPMPSPETATVPLPPNRLSEGIGTRPGLRPPRTPV
mgnify:CR=1 FL=1|jgi:hypothetical protein